MIIHTAICDKCGAKAPAKKEMFGGSNYPDGWGSLYEQREVSLEDKPPRVNIALCHECLIEVANSIKK